MARPSSKARKLSKAEERRPRSAEGASGRRKAHAMAFFVVDVVHFTQYDSSQREEIRRDLQELFNAVVAEHGGTAAAWKGDGAHAVFLAKDEDSCLPCVRAAVSVFEQARERLPQATLRISAHYGPGSADTQGGRVTNADEVDSSEMYWLLKNERQIGGPKVGEPYTVVITQHVRDQLPTLWRQRFLPKASSIKEHRLFFLKSGDANASQAEVDLIRAVLSDYHERLLTAKETAAKLGSTEDIVADLLRKGHETQMVEIMVKSPLDRQLQEELLDLVGRERARRGYLRDVWLVTCNDPVCLKDELGRLAAYELQSLIEKQFVARSTNLRPALAVSCGTTVWATARACELRLMGVGALDIYSLLITMSAQADEPCPAGIVNYLTRVFPGSTGHTAQFPKIHMSPDLAASRKSVYQQDCEEILNGARNASFTLTGIGAIGVEGETHSFNALIAQLGLKEKLQSELGAVGEMCYQPLTEDGDILMGHEDLALLRSNVIYVALEVLQRRVQLDQGAVFAVAGGADKHRAILAALKARAFNYLVTDVETARFILAYYH
jgi:DNA-binding transcriptional regulator LsrR (DeoR family)